jgi:C-terminal peptidase prc
MAGDRITKIEDKSTYKLSADECIKLLTGEPGTPVSFTIQRDGQDIPFTLNRAPITSKSVRGIIREADGSGKWQYLIDPASKVAYIRLSQFTPSASREVAEALQASYEQAIKAGGNTLNGLILDLRNNPGGVMEGALDIADMFLDDGTIMTVRGRNSPAVNFPAEADGTLPDFPMAVLVNQASASASEIVSGALRDHDRAIIVGTRTYGKGLVQTVQHLPHAPKAQVKFTTQRYYLPSGRLIQRTDESTEWGVDPSPGFYIPMTDKEQYEAFLKRRDWDILRKEGNANNGDQNWASPDWIREHALDTQLAAALQAVQAKIADGPDAAWKPVSEVKEEHGALQVAELKDLYETRRLLGLEFAAIEKRISALNKQADSGAKAPERADLWSDTIDLTGGKIDVLDKDGHAVATLKVTGRDVERWLLNADIEPVLNSAETPPGEQPTSPKTSDPALDAKP